MLPWYYNIPFVTIFLCMIGGITMPLYRSKRTAFRVASGIAAAVAVLSALLLVILAAKGEHFSYKMGHYPAPWGNEICAGPLEAMLALMFSAVMFCALLGGRKSVTEEVLEKKQGLYFLMMCMLLASMQALTYTNDIFTGYVFIEISTLAACTIVVARDTAKTVAATIRYLVISLLGSGLFLIGLVLLYSVTGHLLMPNLQEQVQRLFLEHHYIEPLTVVVGLITTGVAIKCSLFPFYAWLPQAHGSATATSSAVMSGLVLKAYIVFLIKFIYRVFTMQLIEGIRITDIMFAFGLLGMVIGSIKAIREEHIKRMLAYSTVAQIGYIFMGIGLGTDAGTVAAVFQIFAHAVTKPLLFLSANRLSAVQGHEKSLYRLRGSARTAKLAGVCFTLGALSMVGIPLLSGFAVKYYLSAAALLTPAKMWTALIALAVSAVLNAVYYIPAVIAIWTPSEFERVGRSGKDPLYGISAVTLSAAVIGLGVCSGPVLCLIRDGLYLL